MIFADHAKRPCPSIGRVANGAFVRPGAGGRGAALVIAETVVPARVYPGNGQVVDPAENADVPVTQPSAKNRRSVSDTVCQHLDSLGGLHTVYRTEASRNQS